SGILRDQRKQQWQNQAIVRTACRPSAGTACSAIGGVNKNSQDARVRQDVGNPNDRCVKGSTDQRSFRCQVASRDPRGDLTTCNRRLFLGGDSSGATQSQGRLKPVELLPVTTDDERAGLPSASEFSRLLKCRASFLLSKRAYELDQVAHERSAAADLGTK